MIAAFGLPAEPEPGELYLDGTAVRGMHITRLRRMVRARPTPPRTKSCSGRRRDTPIVLAPANDLLGLCVAEGIEDALSIHEVTGLGAWAAGSASRMPALALAMVPPYVEVINIAEDNDEAGRRHAHDLAARAGHGAFPSS